MDNLKVSRNPRTPSAGKVRSRIAVTGAFAALSLALAGCGGGTKNAYQSVDSELEYFGWIVVDGDAVTFIDPDSDGVQQAISDIEENQINPDSDAYDVERGALNESKDMVSLEGGDSASIEFVDGLLRVNGDVVFVEYDSELAKKDRGAAAPAGG